MKKLTLLIMILAFYTCASGQQAITGSVTGRVIDNIDSTPFIEATVAIYSSADSSLVSGSVTDKEGRFVIPGIPSGDYYLLVKYMGYEQQSVDFHIGQANGSYDTGDIRLSESTLILSGVSVVASRPQVIYKDDKKILKVDEYRKTGATTLAQVLQNAPSITTDAEGNVYLRGSSSYTLLIDGKPAPNTGTNLLRQIPPEMVESIEIMTNPSAKYDPDGVAGIINLVLKKQKEAGFNGMITAMTGLGNKYNGDAQFNYRKNKINLFGGVSGTSYQTDIEGELTREAESLSGPLFINTMLGEKVKVATLTGNLGADITFNEKSSLTISSRFGPVNQSVDLINRIFTSYPDAGTEDYAHYNNKLSVDGFFYNPDITFTREFKKEGQKLQASLFTGGFNGNIIQNLRQNETDENWQILTNDADTRESALGLGFTDTRFKVDFETPAGENSRIETGIQAIIQKENTDNIFRNYNNITGEWETNTDYTNRYDLNNYINSAYFTWSGKAGKFSYQAGLRAELNNRIFNQITLDEQYKYDKFSFFPSGNVTRTFEKDQQIQFSYSRRINRPGRNNLNPFPQFVDYQTIARGNPYVRPEYINSFEFSYQKRIKPGFLSAQAYYRNTNDVITSIISSDGTGSVFLTSSNANKSSSAGTELMANLQLKKWFRFMTSGNIYYNKLVDLTMNPAVKKDAVTWNLNSNLIFMFSPTTSFSLTGRYNGPSITVQGSQSGNFMMNLGLNQSILKKKGALSLGVQDLLGTYRVKTRSETEDLVFRMDMRPESQIFTLTFTYNFNNYKRRSTDQDQLDMNIIR